MPSTITGLLEKISLGEDSTIELKEKLPQRDSLADAIVAFANSGGGIILIGVTNDGEIVGIDSEHLQQSEKTVIEVCQDSIKPSVNIHTEKMVFEDKKILKIEVPHSLFVHKSPNGYFRRHGSSKREMPPEQLARLFQERSQAKIISFDERVVPDTGKEIFQKDLYMRFIKDAEKEQENDRLRKRRLLINDNGVDRASIAGLLMCSEQPENYLYNSYICAVCYQGLYKDANYQLDAKDFKGPLDRQIQNAYQFIKKYNQVSARKTIAREEHPQYSMKAVFEALVNAVVHRDYSKYGAKIRLFLFSDRIELISPGALANTLTVDNLPYNQVSRNHVLAGLLSELSVASDIGEPVGRRYFLERRGEGVGIILRESEQLSGQTPLYKMYNEEELHLTIYAAKPLRRFE